MGSLRHGTKKKKLNCEKGCSQSEVTTSTRPLMTLKALMSRHET